MPRQGLLTRELKKLRPTFPLYMTGEPHRLSPPSILASEFPSPVGTTYRESGYGLAPGIETGAELHHSLTLPKPLHK